MQQPQDLMHLLLPMEIYHGPIPMLMFSCHCLQLICKLSVPLVIPALEDFFKNYKSLQDHCLQHGPSLETKQVSDAHHFPDQDIFIVPHIYAKQYVRIYPEP